MKREREQRVSDESFDSDPNEKIRESVVKKINLKWLQFIPSPSLFLSLSVTS